jgi:hypothetical protein
VTTSAPILYLPECSVGHEVSSLLRSFTFLCSDLYGMTFTSETLVRVCGACRCIEEHLHATSVTAEGNTRNHTSVVASVARTHDAHPRLSHR